MKSQRSFRKFFLGIISLLGDFFIQILRFSPMFLQARIRESIGPTGSLDFPNLDIVITVNSRLELKRLFPCREEPGTVDWIVTHMKPGDCLFDIGSNVGAYSFIARAVAKENCSIYAFEPNPFTYSSLSKNILLNRYQDNITALNLALSDSTEIVPLKYSTLRSGAASHALIAKNDIQANLHMDFQHVLSYRLDDLMIDFDIPMPNHIKLDVDGGELKVLLGAKNVLGNPNLRSILIEIDHNISSYLEVLQILNSNGFDILKRHAVHRESSNIFNYILIRSH